MLHKLYRITNFELIGDYTIRIQFDDNSEQIVDFQPVLYGEMWGPLQDRRIFRQVAIDPIAHTLTWPNGADFDPETLRNWPEYREELAARAQQWQRLPALATA